MIKRVIILTFAVLLSAVARAGVPLEVKYGPWVTNVSETGFDVLWVTPDTSLVSVAVFPDDGSIYYAEPRPLFYESIAGRRIARQIHCVHVSGLEPGTTYRYRIFGKTQLSPDPSYAIPYGGERDHCVENKVRTLDRSSKTCKFSIVNDIHAKKAIYRDLVTVLDRETTDFIVLNGDMVNSSHRIDTVIKYTYDVVKDVIGSLPVFYVNGNHETRGEDFYILPSITPSATGEYYYSFRQGPAAFIVLDGGEDKPDNSVEYSGTAAFDQYREQEIEWLKKAVQDEDFVSAPYKIVLVHIPPTARQNAWYGEKYMHDKFLPILNAAGIDIMFCGHMHEQMIIEKGKWGNDFPIVINSNTDRVDVTVTEKDIKYNIVPTKIK